MNDLLADLEIYQCENTIMILPPRTCFLQVALRTCTIKFVSCNMYHQGYIMNMNHQICKLERVPSWLHYEHLSSITYYFGAFQPRTGLLLIAIETCDWETSFFIDLIPKKITNIMNTIETW